MGGKSSAPAAPDYRGAAVESAEASRQITRDQTYANRPNQYTPWGSNTWESSQTIDPSTGESVTQWDQNINLSPQQQQALDDQMAMQAGRSAISRGMLGSANEEMATPENFWNDLPDVAGAPTAPDFYGQGLPEMGQFPDPNAGAAGPIEGQPEYKDLQQFGQAPQTMQASGGMLGPVGEAANQGTYNPESVQRELDYSGLEEVNAGGGVQDRFAQTNYDRNMSLMGPRMEQQTEAMDVQLRNQGLRPGTEAYDRSMKDMRDQQGEQMNRLSQDSVMRGSAEQQRQFERELASRQQGVSEVGTQGMFGNQAAGQAFQQNMDVGGRQFSEGMQGAQFAEQQRAARGGEQGQQFGQELSAAQLANQQRSQQFGEMQTLQSQQGGQQDAAFQRQLQSAQFANQQRQQAGNEQLAFGRQGFDQQAQQSNMQNQLRQQAIAEQQQREGWSLNKMNAMMSGQQVGMPSMPSFSNAQRSETPNFLGAAQSAGQYGMDAAQMQASQRNATMGAIGSIGGALMPSWGW